MEQQEYTVKESPPWSRIFSDIVEKENSGNHARDYERYLDQEKESRISPVCNWMKDVNQREIVGPEGRIFVDCMPIEVEVMFLDYYLCCILKVERYIYL